MAEGQGTIETNDNMKSIQDNSPNTFETGTFQETKESKGANKTLSSTKKNKKKKNKPSNLEINSGNNNYYSVKKFHNISRTESNE